ncbi:hypothetical protein N181_28015 [Sinorhizobium fredii USDA 205]|nr:hypothetical protein AOX55_00002893 [Sinorhizobium fredii CCBAU 25509]KSV81703.1 hypothetical protein N181_28015 [Sinorhizobium fredii USDA 205]
MCTALLSKHLFPETHKSRLAAKMLGFFGTPAKFAKPSSMTAEQKNRVAWPEVTIATRPALL